MMVSTLADTVCPGATVRISDPVFAAYCAVELKRAPALSSLMVESGVTEPSSPLIVIVDPLLPVSGNCGLKEAVIVLVAPGTVVLCEIDLTLKDAER